MTIYITKNEVKYDLSRFQAKSHVRKYPSSEIFFSPLCEINTENGYITFTIKAEQTKDLQIHGTTFKETQKFVY